MSVNQIYGPLGLIFSSVHFRAAFHEYNTMRKRLVIGKKVYTSIITAT